MSNANTGTPQSEESSLGEVRKRIEMSPKERPSVILTSSRIHTWKKAIATDPSCKAVAEVIEKRAGVLLSQPPCTRQLEGRRLLAISHEVNRCIILLALSWYQTGDVRFAERAAKELRAISQFTDWNPSHFLDTAVLAMAAGIGYDAFYEELDGEVRQELRRALVTKGLRASLSRPDGSGAPGWVTTRSNWNQVCHGGLVVGALALRAEEPELVAQIVHRAIVNVPKAVSVYEPDGAYPEGPGYWEFGTSFNAFMIEALETALGTNFGLANLPGFRASAAFMLHATGPTGLLFNFADNRATKRNSPTLYWFVRRFGDVDLVAEAPEMQVWSGNVTTLGNGAGALLSPLWHSSYNQPPRAKEPFPLDAVFQGRVPVVMLRSSWTDPRALYLGIKAGSPAWHHGHVDGGSFVFEANGVRWAWDLGPENYHHAESTGMKFWDMRQESDRWRFFRQGGQSHNIVTIDGAQQRVDGTAQIVSAHTQVESPSIVLDLSGLYSGQATTVHRTFRLPNRRELIIGDRLEGLKSSSRVRWAMVTPAQVTVEESGVMLRQGDNGLRIYVNAPQPVKWHVFDLSRPANDFDSPNPGYFQIAFELEAPSDGRLAWEVMLTPQE